MPGAGGAGLVHADRQTLQQPEMGADGGRADALPAFGLHQNMGRFPQPECRHMGPVRLKPLENRPRLSGGLIGKAPGTAQRDIKHQIAHRRP